MEHTKLPWIIYEITLDGEIVGICKKDDEDKIVCGDMKLKDAEYIVRCVNSHEDLLVAAKAMNAYVKEYSGSEMSQQFLILTNNLEQAISRAEPKKE